VAFASQGEIRLAPGSRGSALVRDGKAVDHDAAPLLDIFRTDRPLHVGYRCQGNRRIGCSDRENLRAAVDDHEVLAGAPGKRRAGFDCQDRAVAAFSDSRRQHLGIRLVSLAHEQAALEDVRAAFGQRGDRQVIFEVVAGADEGLRVRAVRAVVTALDRLPA